MKRRTVDAFHRHEALDRTYVVYITAISVLENHPGCRGNKAAYKHVEKAIEELWKAYQAYGSAAL